MRIPRRPEGAYAKCGVLRTHTGEVCNDHLGTRYSGCSRESSDCMWSQDVCVQCARDGPGGAQRKCVRLRGERLPSAWPTAAVAGPFGEMQTIQFSAERGPSRTRIGIVSVEVETRIASAVGRALNRQIITSNNGNPLKTGAGAVS